MLSMVSKTPSVGNTSIMSGFPIRKFLFLLAVFLFASVAHAATFTISTPTANGTFTLSWSGARTYVELYEKVNGVNQKIGDKYNISGTLDITKPPGTYTFVLGDILVYGNQSGGPYTTGTTIEKSVTVSAPTVPPVIPASITVNPDHFLDKIDIFWPVTNGATSYELQRNGTTIYSGSATSHQPSSLAANVSYTFQVRACNSYGCSGWRAAAAVSLQETFGLPTTSTTGQYDINIMTPSSATHTRIEESSSASGPWNTIATLAGNQTYPLTRINGTFYYRLLYCVITTQSSNCTLRNQIKSIVVSQPKPSISASFNPSTINEGGSATLNWNASNATSCSASGIGGVSLPSGSATYTASNVMSTNAAVNVTVTCAGGGGNNSAVAPLNVNWINDAPTISGIASRNINEDASTGAIGFTVGDEETSASDLDVTATSSSTTLIPNGNIQLGGSGSSRTITVTPVANLSGSAEITVAVKDASNAQAISKFMVNVAAVDDAPVIAAIGNVSVNELNETNVNVTITDVDSQVSGVNVTSSSPTLVTPTLSGSGNSYSINIKAARINSSTSNSQATINVNVPFGSTTVSRGFTVTVNNLTPQLWIEETGIIGVYDIKWDYATSAAKIYENGADITTTINSQGFAGPTGTKRITKTSNGTFTYYIQDCVGVTLQGLTCSGTYSQKVHNVIFPIPAAPAFKPNPTPNNTGSYSIEWNGVSYPKRYELFENDVAVANDGNPLFVAKPYSNKTTGTYNYKVRACNDSGCGGFSTIQTVKVANPGAVSSVNAVMNSVTGVASLTLTTTGTAMNYEVQSRLNGGAWGTTRSYTSKTFNFPTATTAGTYSYQARACANAGGYSACSAWVLSNNAALVLPAVPALTVPVNSDSGDYVISWVGVTSAATYVLTENMVDIIPAFTTQTSYRPPVKANGSYNYAIRACNVAGCSAASTLKKIDVAKIGAMTPVTATISQTTGESTLTWNAVSGATRYDIYHTDGYRDPVFFKSVTTTSTTMPQFPPLGGQMLFPVRACAVVGSFTNCNQAITSNVVSLTQPDGTIVVSPSLNTTGEYTVSWLAMPDATRYELYENGQRIQNTEATFKSFTGPNRKANGTYTYKVISCAPLVCGGTSNTRDTTVQLSTGSASSAATNSSVPGSGSGGTTSASQNSSAFSNPELVSKYVNSPPITGEPQGPLFVGSLKGEFKVNESGAATYTVAIATADGVAGVKPQLSIGYNSQAGNGLLGKGWSINGLGSISRCRQTVSQDNAARPLTWTANDRFCLNGQRLMLASTGSYGAVGATYRTEIESFVTVTSVGGSAGHPDYFEVTAKDGSTTTYGALGSSNSEVSGRDTNGNIVANRILTWNISKFQDSVGNPIYYQYDSGANYHYLREIQYAYGVSKVDSNYGARVVFHYKDRTDILGGYVAGYFIGNNKLLEKISTYSEGNLLRNYHLYYEQSPFSLGNDNRIHSIQECVEDSTCYPPTFFEWETPEASFTADEVGKLLGGFTRSADIFLLKGFSVLDVNGNGMLDYVWSEKVHGSDYQNIRYSLDNATVNHATNNSKQLLPPFDTTSTLKFQPIDYNADGRQDLLVHSSKNKKWYLYMAVPSANGWDLEYQSNFTLPFTEKDIQLGDTNSDGLVDVTIMRDNGVMDVYTLVKDTTTAVTSSRRYKFSTKQTYTMALPPDVSTEFMIVTNNKDIYRLADFNGDGRSDLFLQWDVYPDSGSECPEHMCPSGYYSVVYLWDGSNYVYSKTVLSASVSIDSSTVSDLNGDGLPDIAVRQLGGTWNYVINTGNGFTAAKQIRGLDNAKITQKDINFIDMNRDGFGDFLWRHQDGSQKPMYIKYWNPQTQDFGEISTLLRWTFDDTSYLFADANGDGWIDSLQYSADTISPGLLVRGHPGTYYEPVPSQSPIIKPDLISAITDGLGNKTKILYEPIGRSPRYVPVGDAKITSNTFQNCWPSASGYQFYRPAGCEDVTTYDTNGFYKQVSDPFDYADTYSSTLPDQPANAYKLDAPVIEITGPLPVVARVESTAPSAGETPGNVNAASMSAIEYQYKYARMQAKGRGMLGFGVVASIDQQTGIKTETVYRQDWPYIGVPLATTTKTADDKLLSESVNVWSVKTFGSAGKMRFSPQVTKTIDRSYSLDSDGSVGASPIQTITTDTVMSNDEHGNVDSIVVTTAGDGITLVKSTTNTYVSGTWEKSMGRLQSTTVTTQRITASGTEDDSSRTADFEYYTSGIKKGLLHKEYIEKGTDNELETTYTYDNWGNKTQVSVKGKVNATTTETRITTTAYDANGRFQLSTTNDLNHSSSVTGRNKFGIPNSGTDINGVGAQTFHNPMGEKYLQIEGTGAWTRNDVLFCGNSIPGVSIDCSFSNTAIYFSLTRVAGGGMSIEYFDSLGRVIRSGKIGFDGRWIYVDTEYDSLTRIKHQSLSYFAGETPAGWTTNHYDSLGRVTRTVAPDTTESTITYTGNESTVRNSLGQTRTETRNGLNQLVRVEDNIGGTVVYDYNLKGDLLTATTDDAPTAAPNYAPITVRICYDHLGRKIAMHDPDKGGFKTSGTPSCASATTQAGWWKYQYNAFGELILQTDPKGQSSTLAYDKLGRMIRRTDKLAGNTIDAHTRWYYDTAIDGSAQTGAKGQVTAIVMSKDGSETCGGANHCTLNAYDSHARPLQALVMLPNDTTGYMAKTDYDSIGRVYEQRDVLEGQVFTESGVQTQYNQYGYAYRTVDIKPVDGSNGVLNTIRAMNAQGQVTEELRGNGATTVTTYYPETGLLKSQRATISGLKNIQDNAYVWDDVGNLTSRATTSAVVGSATNKNKGEAFCYDGLNRLVATLPTATSTCAGVTAQITYDGFGNIRSKVGVGTYAYSLSNAGSHAVTSVNGVAYVYDANGNVVSGDGRNFEYTSYDMARKISKDSTNYAEFSYGPDRARWQRIDRKGSTITTTTYLGNVERISTNASTLVEWKRNVGGVIFTYKTNNNQLVSNGSDKKFAYVDHLGSVDAITDTLGKVSHTMSFDAWGARRGGSDWANWSALTVTERATVIANALKLTNFVQPVTTRGYTGHEMVDDMGIIHMNGRIYDARIGRFLQADPFIQAASNTQSYNRYSYVLNNPLNATDPSGFFFSDLKKAWNKIRPYVSIIVAVVLSIVLCEGTCTMEMYALIGGASGAAGAAANGGNVLQGAITGAVSAVVFYGIGNKFKVDMLKDGSNFWDAGVKGGARHIFAHAVAGGTLSVLQGGKFGHGFVSAGLTKGFDANFNINSTAPGAFIGETVVVAVVGGTISQMTGGKFANGAQTAAFAHLFNEKGLRKLADSLRSLKALRTAAVDKAWEQEMELVKQTGVGTRRWSPEEIEMLKAGQRPPGYHGHHINSVKGMPGEAGNPNNIEFLTRAEHLKKHGGNWRNITFGDMVDRSVNTSLVISISILETLDSIDWTSWAEDAAISQCNAGDALSCGTLQYFGHKTIPDA